MKKQSKRLSGWGNASSALGVIAIIVGIFAAFLDAPWGGGLAAAGLGLLVYAPLLNGFAVIVQNAEDQIEAREKAQKEEDDKVVVDWRASQK
jgi:hypothetical protein